MQKMTALPLLLLLLQQMAAGAGAQGTPSSVINTTCAAMFNFTTAVGYDYCVASLSADQAGASATDARGLLAVTANLTAANVTSTVLVIADLVNSLQHCLQTYREMNETVAAALEDIHAGRLDAASKKLEEAGDEPSECDILLFQGSALKNPLRKENMDAYFLSYMTYGITMEVLHASHAT